MRTDIITYRKAEIPLSKKKVKVKIKVFQGVRSGLRMTRQRAWFVGQR
jgi:hypothetical protein